MPAIQPARLKQQAALLAEHFEDPPAFVRSLHHLFDFYAERVRRGGQVGDAPPLLAAYRVRPPVLRQIEQEMAVWCAEDPQGGLALCEALWEQPVLEFRLLATALLGQLPCQQVEEILARVRAWIRPGVEPRLVAAVFEQGLGCLRRQHPAALIRLVEGWLGERDLFYQELGLRLLLTLARDPAHENLPAFFRLIQPLVRNSPARLRPDVLDILEMLARRSPKETAYFLRETALLPNSPATPFLIRQLVKAFPEEVEEDLRRFTRQLGDEGRKEKSTKI